MRLLRRAAEDGRLEGVVVVVGLELDVGSSPFTFNWVGGCVTADPNFKFFNTCGQQRRAV